MRQPFLYEAVLKMFSWIFLTSFTFCSDCKFPLWCRKLTTSDPPAQQSPLLNIYQHNPDKNEKQKRVNEFFDSRYQNIHICCYSLSYFEQRQPIFLLNSYGYKRVFRNSFTVLNKAESAETTQRRGGGGGGRR